jgi:hypothetical protein
MTFSQSFQPLHLGSTLECNQLIRWWLQLVYSLTGRLQLGMNPPIGGGGERWRETGGGVSFHGANFSTLSLSLSLSTNSLLSFSLHVFATSNINANNKWTENSLQNENEIIKQKSPKMHNQARQSCCTRKLGKTSDSLLLTLWDERIRKSRLVYLVIWYTSTTTYITFIHLQKKNK